MSIGLVLAGCVLLALAVQSLLTGSLGLIPLNDVDRAGLVATLGGMAVFSPGDRMLNEIQLGLTPLLLIAGGVCVLTIGGSFVLLRLRRRSLPNESNFGLAAPWFWWLLPGGVELLQLLAFAAGLSGTSALLYSLSSLVLLVALAGWLSSLLILLHGDNEGSPATEARVAESGRQPRSPASWPVLIGIGVFIAVFITLNVQLYRGLLVPHGDSAMYEEHLWNLLHGKGFRSYLDQGLFLGEHIQVVHVLLIPIYAIFPSLITLEVCETVTLASGALPVFWMTRRASGSTWCASLLALSWLLYPPLQFLDIAVDLKTFRPISFGVPALLFAFDQYERRRYRTMLLLFAVALLSKEDYALILGPLGLWLAWDALCRSRRASAANAEASGDTDGRPTSKLHAVLPGLGLAVFAVAWLLLCTRVLIPWFRDGAELHYVRYFSRFGDSPGEIVANMITQPGLLWSALATVGTVRYVLTLLLPLAFVPLFGFSRFLVGVPILGLLCLNEIIQSDPMPWHHFHAPLLPVLYWAAVGGLGALSRLKLEQLPIRLRPLLRATDAKFAAAAFCASLVAGAVIGISPLSIQFWSPHSFYAWQKLYVPGPRAELFPKVLAVIPQNARVASTDFVHPRFTHFERSYDYSHYPRRVANYEDRVPDDTDFIVIDTRHYYSEIHTLDQVRELRREPEKWQVLDTGTHGYFIVLKRRESVRLSPDGR
ncbi:DUF2079 domain-containing protein [bacterium]|nr:DUF2079 domain-containing protein [bacterium]